jgi:hypothetical protein
MTRDFPLAVSVPALELWEDGGRMVMRISVRVRSEMTTSTSERVPIVSLTVLKVGNTCESWRERITQNMKRKVLLQKTKYKAQVASAKNIAQFASLLLQKCAASAEAKRTLPQKQSASVND